MCFICWSECPGLLTCCRSAVSLWISSLGCVPLLHKHLLTERGCSHTVQWSCVLIWDESDKNPNCNKYSQRQGSSFPIYGGETEAQSDNCKSVIAGKTNQLPPHLLPGALKLAKATLLFKLLNILLLFLCLVRPMMSFFYNPSLQNQPTKHWG